MTFIENGCIACIMMWLVLPIVVFWRDGLRKMRCTFHPLAVRTNPSGTGDCGAPGGAELIVVGGMHDKKVVESGIGWLKGSLDGE